MSSQPIVVELTPPGRGAVATIAVEGPGAIEAVEKHFRPFNRSRHTPCAVADGTRSVPATFRLAIGRFGGETGEEVVVRVRSEESVEIHCHGGRAAVARIEQLLIAAGCRQATWPEWSSGRHDDPIAAAALVALAAARTERTAAILVDQYRGALRGAIDAIRSSLLQGDAASADRQLAELLARADLGRHLVEPWRVALAGPPNAGKSSLINALVGYRRAIVHAAAGTTRDVVTATTALDGWPVQLADTAGLRQTEHPVERAGVESARRQLAEADLVVLVFDVSQPWTVACQDLLAEYPNSLLVHNKTDLPAHAGPRPPGLLASALVGDGIAGLAESIVRRLVPAPPAPGAAVPFTGPQIERLQQAAASLRQGNTSAVVELLRVK